MYDALSSSVSGVMITNLEGRNKYVNPAFLRIFGYREKIEILEGRMRSIYFPQKMLKSLQLSRLLFSRQEERLKSLSLNTKTVQSSL